MALGSGSWHFAQGRTRALTTEEQALLMTPNALPKLGVPFWGVPVIRTLVFWDSCWGPCILGNYHSCPENPSNVVRAELQVERGAKNCNAKNEGFCD